MAHLLCLILSLFVIGCASAPQFNAEKIRAWETALEKEYPGEKSAIAFYKKGRFELYYLAARHTTEVGSDTFNLVEQLFKEFHFNALLIEPIPHSSGESPKWFVDDSKKGKSEKMIRGGESALGVILAEEKKIPFFGGEPDHKDIYQFLKDKGHKDEDILSFYVVRQIPQWVRQTGERNNLLQKRIPGFLAHYCNLFKIRGRCPKMTDVMEWYKKNNGGQELTTDVANNELAPYSDGKLLTQKISSDIGRIRDRFTLEVIQKLLAKYKKIAVIYGSGHYIALRPSFEEQFEDPPVFVEDGK